MFNFNSKEWHSEQCRQEAIWERAKDISIQIANDVVENDSEAMEIAGDLFGCMEPELGAKILRLMLVPATLNAAREIVMQEIGKTIMNTAERRAIHAIEAEENCGQSA